MCVITYLRFFILSHFIYFIIISLTLYFSCLTKENPIQSSCSDIIYDNRFTMIQYNIRSRKSPYSAEKRPVSFFITRQGKHVGHLCRQMHTVMLRQERTFLYCCHKAGNTLKIPPTLSGTTRPSQGNINNSRPKIYKEQAPSKWTECPHIFSFKKKRLREGV